MTDTVEIKLSPRQYESLLNQTYSGHGVTDVLEGIIKDRLMNYIVKNKEYYGYGPQRQSP